MTDKESGKQAEDLVLEYELDAPPEKVWRAICVPELRAKWLPDRDLAKAEPVSTEPGEEISYRLRDREPPHFESIVTFRVSPDRKGGTILRIAQGLADAARRTPPPANGNAPWLMRAA